MKMIVRVVYESWSKDLVLVWPARFRVSLFQVDAGDGGDVRVTGARLERRERMSGSQSGASDGEDGGGVHFDVVVRKRW